MKVDGHPETAPARPASDKGRFQEALKKAPPETVKPPPQGGQAPRSLVTAPRGATAALATTALARTPRRGAFASAEHLGQVRQGLTAEAHRLRDVRGDAHQTQQERVRQRVTDLIARELAREPRAEPGAPRPTPTSPGPETPASLPPPEALSATGGAQPGGAGGAAAVEPSNPEVRVQAALELIEQIELFVKSQRPALAMRLGGTLDATVEVERTGEREVSLRIQGRRGRFPQKDLARLRDELAARGLKLSALLTS
ncbi:hypothetical protein ATI61_10218 [Archangium gephyra]|uniref:Uncharacterized protein n=1 Tax=Archangium gephyra TaxID=48 RepID=A0AAC8QC67_9BACT|nr:hypothetical protein [Archangium gephyra]AKJ04945.1 Hypothetical protein AA314_06571 [Archangium gephyra]REG35651.1 hypothetical protein ATI61_10218 [Archangium gephyra]